MRTRNFLVPVDLIENFATTIEENDFANCIAGVSAEGDIEISIDYEPGQKKVVNQLQDMIDEHNYDEENETEEDD